MRAGRRPSSSRLALAVSRLIGKKCLDISCRLLGSGCVKFGASTLSCKAIVVDARRHRRYMQRQLAKEKVSGAVSRWSLSSGIRSRTHFVVCASADQVPSGWISCKGHNCFLRVCVGCVRIASLSKSKTPPSICDIPSKGLRYDESRQPGHRS